MRATQEAFHWIVDILEKRDVPFQISGGLAAKVYGSSRELADIDVDVPEKEFEKILPDVKNYIIFGPARYKDENWDLWLMTLRYCEQEIDISGAHEAQIFDKINNDWFWLQTDFSKSNLQEIFGILVPVVAKKELVEYKSRLRRDVDLIDIKEISNYYSISQLPLDKPINRNIIEI